MLALGVRLWARLGRPTLLDSQFVFISAGVRGRAARSVPSQDSEIDDLMVVAAKCGFWNLSRQALIQLCHYKQVDISTGANLFEVCFALVQGVLGSSDSETLQIWYLRNVTMNDRAGGDTMDMFLSLDEGLQCLGRSDEQEVRQTQKVAKEKKREASEFSASFKTKTQQVDPYRADRGLQRNGAARGGRGRGGRGVSTRDMERKSVPEGAITQAEAKRLLPPGACAGGGVRLAKYPSLFGTSSRQSRPGPIAGCGPK